MKKALILGVIALSLATTALAQVKPEDQIKIRQAGYSFMSWNTVSYTHLPRPVLFHD